MREDESRPPAGELDAAGRRGERFDRIAIVGLGLIGGSIALAARKADASVFIVWVDSAEVLRQALELGVVDAGSESLEVVSDSDLLVLAAPVLQNIALIPQVTRHISARTVVTDVGSTKVATMEAARSLGGAITFVGGHPIAGAAARGMRHARADLFVGRRWAMTPGEESSGEVIDRLSGFVRSLGATPHLMGAAEHDRVMAFVSHLPQLAASALMVAAADGAGEAGLALAGPGLEDTTRLAGSPFGIWADICASNAENIRTALDRLIIELVGVRAGLAEPDRLAGVFERARQWGQVLQSIARPDPQSATSRSGRGAS